MDIAIDRHALVTDIFISPMGGEPTMELDVVRAIAEQGLIGDRYMNGTGTHSGKQPEKIRHVSLIAAEDIDAANSELELGLMFERSETLRNIVTRGVPLSRMLGERLLIGDVLVELTGPCDPCHFPSWRAGKPDFAKAFRDGRAGARGAVRSSGLIRVGDPIRLAPAL